MNLDLPCTQAEFGELVGISQPAVSEHISSGVLASGDSAGQWLKDYISNLREQAAGRGAGGDLAYERAIQARVARERNEIQLAKDRREWAAVSMLELFCSHIGRSVAGLLEPLPTEIHKLCPALTPDDVRRIQLTVSKACNMAAAAVLADFDEPDQDPTSQADADDSDDEDAP
jgi:phage terminase Nu1 subunit (DNA packaging protein)